MSISFESGQIFRSYAVSGYIKSISRDAVYQSKLAFASTLRSGHNAYLENVLSLRPRPTA